MAGDCPFCRIIRGESGASIVHEGADVLAFLDVRPVFKGHTLVVPREHHVTLSDLPGHLMVPVFGLTQRLAAAVPAATGGQGTFVALNNVVSQSVAHLHVHVVPRTKGDGLRGFFWPRTRYDEGEADAYAARIAEVLAET